MSKILRASALAAAALCLLTACRSTPPVDAPIIDIRPTNLQIGDQLIIEGHDIVTSNRRSLGTRSGSFEAKVKTTVTLEGTFTYPNRSTIARYDGQRWVWDRMSACDADGLRALWSDQERAFAVGLDGKILQLTPKGWRSMNGMWSRFKEFFRSDPPAGRDLFAVWGSGSTVFAAGDRGAILRFDGRAWKPMVSGTKNQIRALWGAGPNNVFAVGYRGTILHFNGQTWNAMSSGVDHDLTAVWGTSERAVFAAGAAGTILRFNGRRWSRFHPATKNNLHALWGKDPRQVFAAGDRGTILRFDGKLWTAAASGTRADLRAMWGKDDELLVAGDDGVVLKRAGDSFSVVDSFSTQPVAAISGRAGTDLRVVLSRLEKVVRDNRKIVLSARAVPSRTDPRWAERVLVPISEETRGRIGFARFEGRVIVDQDVEKGHKRLISGTKKAPVKLVFFKPSMKSLAQLSVDWLSNDRMLAFLGIAVEPIPGGLRVSSTSNTKPGAQSLYERAGGKAGDQLIWGNGLALTDKNRLTLAFRLAKRRGVVAMSVKRAGTDVNLRIPAFKKPWVPPISLIYLLVMIIFGLITLTFALVTSGLLTWVERRVAARIQSRVGPNRVGPQGLLQWLADGLKLLLKEDVIPDAVDRPLFKLAPYLVLTGLLGTFVALPFGQFFIISDLNIGVLYLVAITGFVALGLMMAGWSSNNKWALLGGMRAAAQIISYEIPAGLALMVPVIMAGSLSTQSLVESQGGWPWQWYIFDNPLVFICFFIYFVSALAEGNRTPFDLPEAESELVAGYQVEYSGWRFAVFMLSEWANIFVIGAIATTVFLGGWQVPGVSLHAHAGWWGWQALGLLLFMAKSLALVFVIVWIRWTLPRFRVDQMMNLCWKYFVPWSFVAIIGVAAWVMVAPSWLRTAGQLLTFIGCGGGLALLFVSRVMYNWRHNPEKFSWKPFY